MPGTPALSTRWCSRQHAAASRENAGAALVVRSPRSRSARDPRAATALSTRHVHLVLAPQLLRRTQSNNKARAWRPRCLSTEQTLTDTAAPPLHTVCARQPQQPSRSFLLAGALVRPHKRLPLQATLADGRRLQVRELRPSESGAAAVALTRSFSGTRR